MSPVGLVAFQAYALDVSRQLLGRLLAVARRTLIVIGFLVALLVLLSVGLVFDYFISSGLNEAGGDSVEILSPVPRVSLPPGHRVYVALGDSYSSGEGVRPYRRGSGDRADGGDRCHRSTAAYPLQLRFKEPVERRFRACSGARINDMYVTQKTAVGQASLGPGCLGQRLDL
jgi:hypothetical protein